MTSLLKTFKQSLKQLVKKEEPFVPMQPTAAITPENALRRQIAWRYLSGNGIEVGALHSPLEVPSNATVRYVDRMPVDEVRKQYPELAEYHLVEVDIIDDGEILSSIADSSVDFVIANHMIEHYTWLYQISGTPLIAIAQLHH